MSLLSRLEQALQALAEGSAEQVFGGRIDLVAVGQELLNRAVAQSRPGVAGPQAPDLYQVHLALDDFRALEGELAHLQREYGRSLWHRLRASGYEIAAVPRVLVVPGERVSPGRFEVEATFGEAGPGCVLTRLGRARAAVRVRLPVAIGRDPSCGLCLDDPSVSRRHAEIRWERNHFQLSDLGSKNGVLRNGAAVTSAPVEPGDVIVLGTERLRLSVDDGTPAPGHSATPT